MRIRAEQKAATRELLVDAARVAIAAKGVAGATVKEIAALAGVTTGALYASFEGKAALVRAVLTERNVSLSSVPVADLSAGIGERLERALEADPVAPALLLQLLAGSQADPELAALVSEAILANVDAAEQRLRTEGAPTKLSPHETALLLQVLVAGTVALRAALGPALPGSLLSSAVEELL